MAPKSLCASAASAGEVSAGLRTKSPATLMKEGADNRQELKARALGLLARREHSRAELARKLSGRAESAEVLGALLDELEARGQLSDGRYAEQRTSTLSRRYGSGRIRQELRAKGVNDVLAAAAVRDAQADDLERARRILGRKYREPATDQRERVRRARFLQGRGFSFDVIKQALRLEAVEGD